MLFKIEKIKVKGSGYDAAQNLIDEQPGVWDYIGSGLCARVYGNESKDWVYKIGLMEGNHGYLSYLKQLSKQKKHNPYTPKIYGVRYYIGDVDSAFVVAIERLKEVRTKKDLYKVDVLADLIRVDGEFDEEFKEELKIKDEKRIKEVMEMIQILNLALKQSMEECFWDLHSGNFMKRGRQLVVTDPLV